MAFGTARWGAVCQPALSSPSTMMRSRPAPASRANSASSAAKNGLETPFDPYQNGTVNLGGAWRGGSGRVGGRHDIRSQVTLYRLSLSGRGHQPRRLALLPLSAEPAHGGRDAGRPRHRREP